MPSVTRLYTALQHSKREILTRSCVVFRKCLSVVGLDVKKAALALHAKAMNLAIWSLNLQTFRRDQTLQTVAMPIYLAR